MKKTLLSVLAGLTVIGSASAVPTPEDRKALCQLLIDKGTHVWVEKTSACIPVNPCKSDDEQIKEAYCIDTLETNYYEVPEGHIKSAEVVNIYAKYLGFNCKVVEKDIFKESGFTFVPCGGADYRVFKFDNENGKQNVTDLFCFMVHGTAQVKYDGWPTICNTSRSSCETIKGLVDNKINVEYHECDKQECSCVIGKPSEDADAVRGYIMFGR